jgi:hypothetical protein
MDPLAGRNSNSGGGGAVSASSINPTAIPGLEIDLLIYVRALMRFWYVPLGLALVLALGAAAWSFTLPNKYESVARVVVVDSADPGGVTPDERRAPEVLTLVEHGFIMGRHSDNQVEVILAKLHSREFTLAFMDAYNVWAQLYPEHWDVSEQRWIDGFVPDRGLGHKVFREYVRFIDHDEVTDLMGVRIRFRDPLIARDWANAYVDMFNQFMRDKALQEVAAKQAFLQAELQRRGIVDIQQSIYRLIEAQTAVAMLVSAREEFALEYIDPAVRAYDRFSPRRKVWVLVGTFSGAMLGVFAVLALTFTQRMLEILKGNQL